MPARQGERAEARRWRERRADQLVPRHHAICSGCYVLSTHAPLPVHVAGLGLALGQEVSFAARPFTLAIEVVILQEQLLEVEAAQPALGRLLRLLDANEDAPADRQVIACMVAHLCSTSSKP